MEPDATPYRFAIADCDVVNKDALELFRQRRLEWLFLYEGDPAHNIRQQINVLMWSDALFRVLNRLRSFGSVSQPTASHNRSIAEFIDNGYIATQVLGISKLTDQWHYDTEKNVVSLPRLLYELKQNAHLITRENFVCFDGLPYDYEIAAERHYESITPEQLGQFRRGPTWGRDNFLTSRLMHQAFDKLSRTQQRSRSDKIDPQIQIALDAILSDKTIERVRGFRNKYLGHAADAVSRRGHALERFGFSLNDFANAQRRLIIAAEVIGSLLGTTVANPIETPQFDVFEFLDRPILGTGNVDTLNEMWHRLESSRDQWRADAISDLLNGIQPVPDDEQNFDSPASDG